MVSNNLSVCLSVTNFDLNDRKVKFLLYNYLDSHLWQRSMKFATQISPLLNCYLTYQQRYLMGPGRNS